MGVMERYDVGTTEIMSDTELSGDDLEMLIELVMAAETAQADPYQSDFEAKAAGMTEHGHVVVGANQENSYSDAYAHGETAVLSQINSLYGRVGIRAIAFYSDVTNPDMLTISPCGACRDVMRGRVGSDLLLAAGNDQRIIASRFGEYLKNDFPERFRHQLDPVGVRNAVNAIDRGMDSYLPPEYQPLVYGVSLVSTDGSAWRGSLYTNAGYDAISPGLSAVQTWQNTVGDESHTFQDLRSITVASYGTEPDVLYRDRQALLELDEQLRQYAGRVDALPVSIITVDPVTHEVTHVAATDTEEWLPRPFSARTFGMDDVVDRHYYKINEAADQSSLALSSHHRGGYL